MLLFYDIKSYKYNNVYMWTSSAIPYIILFCHQQNSYSYSHILFMYHALYFWKYIFTLHVPCFLFFLIEHNQKQMLLIKNESSFFEVQKYFFALFNFCSFLLFLFFCSLLLFNFFYSFQLFNWSYSQRYFNVDQRCETRRWK